MTRLLEFEGLSKTIRDGTSERELWNGLSGRLNAGDLMALTGFSGSGKSTLLNTLSGIDNTFQGKIVALDTDYAKVSTKAIAALRARAFGYVFQSFGLIKFLNVFENVAIGISRQSAKLSSTDEDKIAETLHRVGLANHHRKDVRNLSGGEQQRVGIARAIVSTPQILFADEPTANLDIRTGAGIIELIDEVRAATGMAVIIATHQHELVQHSDQHLTLGH